MSLVTFSLTTSFLLSNAWDYTSKGPGHWYNDFPACRGTQQSPIDIPISHPPICNKYNTSLSLNWDYKNYDLDFIVRNNGKTLVFTAIDNHENSDIKTFDTLNNNQNAVARLPNIWFNTYNNNENKEYCLDSIHFHWGADSSKGSEHTFDGKYSALEVHFLHYSCDYDSLTDALNAYVNGDTKDDYVLSAIGVLFDIGEPNVAIDAMLKDAVLDQIYMVGGVDQSNYKILNIKTTFNINDLLPSNHAFISYHGAITAPPCFETVRWNVLTHKLTVSELQMRKFRSLLTKDNINHLDTNFRPIQNNTNNIYYCPIQIDELMVSDDKDSHALVIVIIAGSIIFFFICLIGLCKYNKKRKQKGFADLNSLSTAGANSDIGMKKLVGTDTQHACYQ